MNGDRSGKKIMIITIFKERKNKYVTTSLWKNSEERLLL